ncbi:MAG: DUF2130 domain-containing protein [Crocinitomicaceae bacterium]|nr:DUF2130 domain-containing protein [Crocinitomicaceae bacterium]
MSESKITCPSCGTTFNAEEAIAKGLEEKLTKEFQEKNRIIAEQNELRNQEFLRKQIELENSRKDFETKQEKAREEYQQKLKEDREKILAEAKAKAEKEAGESLGLRLKDLQETLDKKQKENIELQKKEIEFLKKEQELKDIKEKMDLELQKKILEVKKQSEEEVSRRESEKFAMREQEWKKQMEDQKKLNEEMQRKMEQGSMQLQGEVQELFIEEVLKSAFPFDVVEEVSKGARGADCIQIVRNNLMQDCGKIIYESKRTKAFSQEWISKLKDDMRASGSEIAVLITETLPKDQKHFSLMNGVWVCSFSEFRAVAAVLRDGLIRLKVASESNENKGEKMQMLYSYLTGNEFRQQIEAIVEGFSTLQSELDKEKKAMQLIWKKREKQIEKVVNNTIGLYGSVKGIAGASVQDIQALEGGDYDMLAEGTGEEPPIE